ncbi:MAG TPA: hypothetical protein VIQ30_02580 [Pseudonocardia sp.]
MSGKRRAERPFPRWIPWLLVALMLAAIPVGFVLTRTTASTQNENQNLQGDKSVLTDQRDAAAGQALDLAGQIAAACASGNIPPEYTAACDKARQVQAQPIPPVQGERGPGPTAEQIRGAVAAYLISNPPPAGRAPTPSEVAAAVTQYLTANPPTPGRPPTAGEIASAVSTYFVTNPPRDGVDGKDAPPPTAQQIQAAVDNYLAAHPPPAGKDGKDGATGPTCPNGSSLQSVTYADGRSGLGCVLDQQPATTPTTDPTAGGMPGG